MTKYYRLTYRENNETEILGHFSTQEELDRLLLNEFRIIEEESLLQFDDRHALISGLKAWAKSQWSPNAEKSFTFTYPETLISEFHRPAYNAKLELTTGRWYITQF